MSTVVKDAAYCWEIKEDVGKYKFHIYRNKMTRGRTSERDNLGCIGMASVNLKDDRVYLTEGVSDFLTMKLTHPNYNVIGFTTLGGNAKAKLLITSLFDNICIVSDNDIGKGVNTGLTNSTRMKRYFESYGKHVNIQLPDSGYKDITEQFMGDLRFLSSI